VVLGGALAQRSRAETPTRGFQMNEAGQRPYDRQQAYRRAARRPDVRLAVTWAAARANVPNDMRSLVSLVAYENDEFALSLEVTYGELVKIITD